LQTLKARAVPWWLTTEDLPDPDNRVEWIGDVEGGRVFEAKKKEQVDAIYAQIAEELRSQYMLGYTPDKQSSSGFHAIHLEVKTKDLIVQTREGYYAGH
jgi:VWFA-related protein